MIHAIFAIMLWGMMPVRPLGLGRGISVIDDEDEPQAGGSRAGYRSTRRRYFLMFLLMCQIVPIFGTDEVTIVTGIVSQPLTSVLTYSSSLPLYFQFNKPELDLDIPILPELLDEVSDN